MHSGRLPGAGHDPPEVAMHRRSRPIPTFLAVLLACLAQAAPARAQHCWPSNVALLVRDEQGALIHPRELTGYTYTPERPDSADTQFTVRRLSGSRWGP